MTRLTRIRLLGERGKYPGGVDPATLPVGYDSLAQRLEVAMQADWNSYDSTARWGPSAMAEKAKTRVFHREYMSIAARIKVFMQQNPQALPMGITVTQG